MHIKISICFLLGELALYQLTDDLKMQTNVLNREQAASAIGISINSLDNLVKKGLIAKVQLSPRRIGIMRADLDNYLQSIRSGGMEISA